MAKEAFDNIAAGLKDAIAYVQGDKSRGTAHVIEVPTIDVAAMRKKLGLSQDRFAAVFCVSPSTVRNWEQGRRHPEGPAKVLLRVIDKEPEAVLRALHAAQPATNAASTPASSVRRAARGGSGVRRA